MHGVLEVAGACYGMMLRRGTVFSCGNFLVLVRARQAGFVECGFPLEQQRTPMSLHNVTPGAKAPDEFNVIIEIPMNADPIKYEVDEASGALFVDRFMGTAMHYPCNYGYIPQTLADDGDPVDVLVITPVPLIPGVVVTCRPLGMLKMTDEAGGDNKLLAVPIDKILSIYTQWQKPEDLNPLRLKTIQHFFEHYKDLEPGKWVKVEGWTGPDGARDEVRTGMALWADTRKA
jgi:inorganic pyrophosphatase